ncbi:MAG: hypothetical protein ACI30V_03210 [Muribaculaceae bacterium]
MTRSNKSNHPFHEWVPRPVGILILLMLFVPPTFSGGAYLSNISEMAGGLGLWTEDVQLASFFTSIGMCLFPPFMVPFLQARRTKQTYLACFMLLIVLNGVCAATTSMSVLLAACMLTGLVRVMVMLNCTFTIAPYLTGMDTLSMFTMTTEPPADVQYVLERKRTFLMPVLYFFILVLSQMSNMLTAWFAYEYQWQDAYLVVIGMLMVAMLLVIVAMPDEAKKAPWRVEWRKLPEMLLMAVALCCMTYVLVYGKTLDWLHSKSICIALAVMLFSGGAFLIRSLRAGNDAYLPLDVFRYRNVALSMLLFLATMIFNSANNFVASFARIASPVSNVHCASLSGWAAVGCLIGLLLSLMLVLKKVHFRWMFCVGFLLMAASNVYVFFQYQSAGLFQNLWLPMVLNFSGLLMLYSLVAAWGMKGLPSRYLATFVFLMIWMRNAIAPVAGAAVLSNALCHKQQYQVTRLAQNVDEQNPLAAGSFAALRGNARAQGGGEREAREFACTALWGRVAKQATLVAMRDVTGGAVVCLAVAAVVVLLPVYRRGESS